MVTLSLDNKINTHHEMIDPLLSLPCFNNKVIESINKEFDENGNQLWNKQYIGNESKIFSPISITSDDNGNVYVSGVKLSGFTNEAWWIKKLID